MATQKEKKKTKRKHTQILLDGFKQSNIRPLSHSLLRIDPMICFREHIKHVECIKKKKHGEWTKLPCYRSHGNH